MDSILESWNAQQLVALAGGLFLLYQEGKKLVEIYRSAKQFVIHVLDERMPKAIKDTLSNGGGEIIRRIVKEENEKQTARHADELDRRFRQHEEQEDRRFRAIEDEVFQPRKHKAR